MGLTKCPVCGVENMEFSRRCTSCGSILQQGTRTLDLFSTIYNLWRFPDFIFRKIILAEHRNYATLIALFEAIGLSFLCLFLLKAADIFSVDLARLLITGFELGIVVYLPFLILFSLLSYFAARVSRTGATLKGFMAAMIYGLHPLGVSAIIILPAEIAVFGPYAFSKNPSPLTINPAPFYLLGFLDCLLAIAAVVSILKLSRLLFGARKKGVIFFGIFFILFAVAMVITDAILRHSAPVS